MSNEADFLGNLLPSHPDLEPIIEAIRGKYRLREVYPQDEPIEEIYLDDRIVSMDEFCQDIKNQLVENMEAIFSEDYAKKYKSAKYALEADYRKELENFNDELKSIMETFFEFTKTTSQTVFQILDAQVDQLVNIVCSNLLLGDPKEPPEDWFGKVLIANSGEQKIIWAMISEVTNLDLMFQQIRDTYKKTYGKLPIKVTPKTASTGYYLQLKRRGTKENDFILDEFIRLNKFKLPPKKNITQYNQTREKYAQRLKKRLQKAKLILEAIGRENK